MSTPAILRHRRDTAANWTSNNPVLEAGQIGYETDTLRFKFGNGSTAWNSLAYGVGALADGDVTYAKIQDTTSGSVLLGRGSSGAGEVQEITLGAGLSMSGTTLSSSVSGAAPATADYLVKTADAGLSAERVVTDSTSVTANWSTAGQVQFQRAALTGDVTATANSNATTIANGVVSTAKMGGDVTTAGKALLDDADAAAQRTTLGLGTLATQSGTFSGTSSGTNTGDQTITLTGDVTGSGTGSFAATIASGAVSTTKLGGDITTAGKDLLDDVDASAQRTTLGLGTLATQSGTFSGTSSGTNTGDQTISLTGDVTGSGTGSFAATIANQAVTNAKLANVATSTLKGRLTAGSGNPEDLTGTQATTLLDVFTSSLKGLAPSSGGGTSNFLRADGTWAAPAGGGTSAQVDTFASSGTWTKPSGAKTVAVIVWGGGGKGGGGCGGATSTLRMPGAGGGGGARNERIFDASDLPATVSVTVGLGGTTGGVGGSSANGTTGAAGGATTFGAFCMAGGGGGGEGGNATDNSVGGGGGGSGGASGTTGTGSANVGGGFPDGGTGAFGGNVAGVSSIGGGGGAGARSSDAAGAGGYHGASSAYGAGGGGPGGGFLATNVAGAALQGGRSGSTSLGGGGSAATGTAGANGGNGLSASAAGTCSGWAGGGGAPNSAGTGGSGGTGGFPGGGGGGGGGGTSVGGNGGNGANGYAIVITYF